MAKKEKEEPRKIAVSSALAVKYRPRKLADIVGQMHVTTALRGMLKKGEVPSTFLFEGQTGGGKTTLARLLHYYLNCEKGTICGKCDSCRIPHKAHPDLININAGTDGKVDDIRKLVKGARIAPTFNKRVYIIDEAHKLTGASEDALLVPIEEPSDDTIFILCTTNPEKMSKTLINRCTRFSLKPLEPELIIERCAQIAEAEGVKLGGSKPGKEALKLIADFSGGSMRQAIALLENVIHGVRGGADISSKDVLAAFVQTTEVDLDKAAVNVVAAVLAEDLPAAIRFIRLSGNARGVLQKARWLVDYLIGAKTKTAKFTPYAGRLFDKIASDKGIKLKLSALLGFQLVLVNAEMKMNTTSIDESVLLQTAIAEYAMGE